MPSIRQRFHLSPCSDFRSHFCQSGLRSLDPARKAGRNNPSDFELAGTARYHLVQRAKWPSRSPRETQRDPCATPIVGVRPPRHVEVRLSDLPRRDPTAMAIVARAQPQVDPRRVVVLLAYRHRPTKVPLPRSRRRSDLLRVDRFDRHPPRRPPWPAIDHPPQSQELLEPTQPPTRRRHGKARPHDRRRTSCDRRGEGGLPKVYWNPRL